MNEFERVAAAADEGLSSELGFVRRLDDEGRLKHWLVVLDFVGEDGRRQFRLHHDEDEEAAAIGLARYAEDAMLAAGDSVEPE